MSGVFLWGWDDTNSKWVKILVNADGKLELASLEDAEISQDTPEDLKHVPHGYYSGGPSYLPLAVDSAGKLQISIEALEHLNDIADVDVASPSDGEVLYWNDTNGAWEAKTVLENVVEDTTPQLGGDLDCQDKKLTNLLGLLFKTATELTISSGAITVTQALHTVDTEGDAASDDLDTINGGTTVNMIVIKADNDARTVVVKHNTGNIWLQGKADISLDDLEDGLLLVWDGTKWFDIAAGGAGAATTEIHDADNDTKVDTEESSDEDHVRMDVKGVEVFDLDDAGVLTLAKQSSACAHLGSDQTVATATVTVVDIDTELWDIQAEFNTSTHRFVAKTAGIYLAIYGWRFTAGSDGDLYVGYIRKNGTEVGLCQGHGSSTYAIAQMVTVITQLSVNDYLEVVVYQNSGSNKTLTGGSAQYNRFSVYKLA